MSQFSISDGDTTFEVNFDNTVSGFTASSGGISISDPDKLSELYRAAQQLHILQQSDLRSLLTDSTNAQAVLSDVVSDVSAYGSK